MKKVFMRELNLITSPEVANLVEEALSQVSSGFYTAKASSTGKYHSKSNNTSGGLVRHTQEVFYMAFQIINLKQYQTKLSLLDRDVILAACLLHDVCKSGRGFQNTTSVHNHPLLVRGLLRGLSGQRLEIWSRISTAVESHSGEFTTNFRSNVVLPEPSNLVGEIVHLADFLASRRDINLSSIHSPDYDPYRVSNSWKNHPASDKQVAYLQILLKGFDLKFLPESEVTRFDALLYQVQHGGTPTKGEVSFFIDLIREGGKK